MDVLFYLKMEKAVLQGRGFKPNLLIRNWDLRIFLLPSDFVLKRHQLFKGAVSDIGITQFVAQNFADRLSSNRQFDAYGEFISTFTWSCIFQV